MRAGRENVSGHGSAPVRYAHGDVRFIEGKVSEVLCGRLPEHLQALGRLERWQSGGAERGTGQRRASEGDERLRMRACGSEGVATRVGGRATMRALGLCALNHGSNADTVEQQRMELVVAGLQGAREPAVCHRRTQ